MLSNLMAQLGNHLNAQVEENMVRHMVVNAIRSYKQKFSDEYGEIIIACDNTNYWRKQIFPYYKANRKKAISESELNWKSIFDCMNKIRSELKEYFPYRVIDVETAEADDVIAALVGEFGRPLNTGEKILILSGDKDFIQLHVHGNVSQYDPVRKKWIKHNDPAMFLNEHVLKGDSGDGIPNVLSEDDCLVTGTRQKPLTAKRMNQLLHTIPGKDWDERTYRNFCRNRELIDLSWIPNPIKEKVLTQYNEQTGKNRSKLMNYFIVNKLKNLAEYISDF
jgi:5'-3' exonuclease, N-terminal resolvase-like domain/T4 RNase H, C terminal